MFQNFLFMKNSYTKVKKNQMIVKQEQGQSGLDEMLRKKQEIDPLNSSAKKYAATLRNASKSTGKKGASTNIKVFKTLILEKDGGVNEKTEFKKVAASKKSKSIKK
mmetsp:Transcript_7408/g.12514  ORF Transcript_7408/g.12514 Transcript_7408/m.12514 type:complete len:106 (-) Transcript_7408:130-447(-)